MLKKFRGGRPSAPMVLSVIALVFSLAGTGVAGVATISALSKSEKKQTKKIAKNQVNTLAPNLSVKSAGTVSDGAITTAKLGTEAVTANKLATLVERSEQVVIADNAGDAVTADCNAGERVISGGTNTVGVGTELGFTITREARSGNGWSANARNETGDDATLIVEAYCLQAG